MTDRIDDATVSAAHRVRSLAILLALVLVLGSLAAGLVGATVVVLSSLIDHALG